MKTLIALLLFISIGANAQIIFEQTYANGGNGTNNLHLVNLSASGHKWVTNDTSTLTIYNLNHTVFRTIPIPYTGPYNTSGGVLVYNVSEELFNLNPNDVEFMVRVFDASYHEHVYIYDELGNTLFARDSVQPGGYNFWSQEAIVYTSQGTKLILSKTSTREAFVYSLPGSLPCDECTGGVVSGLQPSPSGPNGNQQQLPNPYPNPTNSATTIPYQLPVGVSTGQLIIYDLLGQEVRRYGVTNAFTSIEIAAGDLAAGMYSYSLQTSAGTTTGKKFVVAKP